MGCDECDFVIIFNVMHEQCNVYIVYYKTGCLAFGLIVDGIHLCLILSGTKIFHHE